nr:hypothetical protein [Paenibacillus allorhizosphaerae]
MVLIVSFPDDLHAESVCELLSRKHVQAERVDLSRLNEENRLTLSLNGQLDAEIVTDSGKRIRLSETRTVWWRRPRLPDAPTEQRVGEISEFVRSEWEHFIEGLEGFANVRWVNLPSSNRLAARKGIQLAAAHKLGLRIPRTIVTNDAQRVREFADEGYALVYKRIGSAPRPLTATKDLLPSDLERLHVLTACPAIFQEKIEARLDIRVTAIGPDLYAAEIDSQSGSSPLDWRFDHSVPFRPHRLDQEVEYRLKALLERLGLFYGAIDLRLTPEGEYVFLEINPSGQYLFVELLSGIPLTERMAEYLSG